MTTPRFSNAIAVFAIIIKDDHILLQKRSSHTLNGNAYDTAASGHVEKGETLKQAMCRELKEEIGIIVTPNQLQFAILGHCFYHDTQTTYHTTYFIVNDYIGSPTIQEKHKISDLSWFSLKNLPTNLSPDRRVAITSWLDGKHYFEYGFTS